MNTDRLNDLVHNMDPGLAVVIREFAGRPQDEQLVYLFKELQQASALAGEAKTEASLARAEVRELTRVKPMREKLQEYGVIGSIIAYALIDQHDKLPPFLGGGGR